MELKQISIDEVYSNFSQPRENFDEEKLKELAESILGNELIQPITVREVTKGKDKYMIVAGERRVMAHRIAGLKTIQAVVKKYKNDVDWQVESLVENLQRENLTSIEREKYVYTIWKTGAFKNREELAKKIGASREMVEELIYAKEIRAKEKYSSAISTRQIRAVRSLDEDARKRILKKAEKGELGGEKVLREYSKTIKKAPTEVKEALLDDRITVEQAERISKLKSEPERTKAIQEHKNISMVEKGVERNIEHQMSAKEKRELDKRLIQAGSWITSFRGSVTTFNSEIEKTLKMLLLATQFLPVMDEKQKERLEIDLDRLIEKLEKGLQFAEQIKNKI